MPIYNLTQCSGIHGHVKVGPDGTAYVPNKNCGGEQGLAVTPRQRPHLDGEDRARQPPASCDPSVGIATDGTVYFGYMQRRRPPLRRGLPRRRRDLGQHAGRGHAFGIQNIAFPAVVAGDPDRAAFAFLGTTDGAATSAARIPTFPAVWHLYVAHTYDGGATWVTADATPTTRCSAAPSAPPAPPAAAPAT